MMLSESCCVRPVLREAWLLFVLRPLFFLSFCPIVLDTHFSSCFFAMSSSPSTPFVDELVTNPHSPSVLSYSRTLSSRSKTHSLGIGISPPIVSPTYSTSTSHSHHSRSQSQSRSHVRSPSSPTAAISTPSGALDSLSRTLRGYSPFPAPSASTAAAVSSSSRRRHEELIPTGRRDRSAEGSYEDRRKQEFEREYEREDNDDSFGYGGAGGYGYGHRARSTRSPPSATMNEGPTTTTSGLTERLRGSPSPLPLNQQRKESGQRRGDVEVEGKKTVGGRGGGGDEVDRVVWARWERLRSGEGSAKGR